MNQEPITPLLLQMTDGYSRWQENDRRRRKRHNLTLVVVSLLFAVTVNTMAMTLTPRYSSFDGTYGPNVVPVVDYILSKK